MITGPLFKCFGSKWQSSKQLPRPEYNDIFEPFAGGAGYSLRHYSKNVTICEQNEHVYNLWHWLINSATDRDILEIPLDMPEGIDIRQIGLSTGQALLLKNWQRTNNVGNCWTISSWGCKPGQWTKNTRARISNEIGAIKHWKVERDAFNIMEIYQEIPSTWFIDPPYQYNYQYGLRNPIDYIKLAEQAKKLIGQKIVCEAICQKTGAQPNWLTFETFGDRVTSRRKADNNHHSKELIWVEKKLS